MDRTEPTLPIDRNEPVDPMDSTELFDHSDQREEQLRDGAISHHCRRLGVVVAAQRRKYAGSQRV
jgi:hypothetical protein